jgi:hypothetical protein
MPNARRLWQVFFKALRGLRKSSLLGLLFYIAGYVGLITNWHNTFGRDPWSATLGVVFALVMMWMTVWTDLRRGGKT